MSNSWSTKPAAAGRNKLLMRLVVHFSRKKFFVLVPFNATFKHVKEEIFVVYESITSSSSTDPVSILCDSSGHVLFDDWQVRDFIPDMALVYAFKQEELVKQAYTPLPSCTGLLSSQPDPIVSHSQENLCGVDLQPLQCSTPISILPPTNHSVIPFHSPVLTPQSTDQCKVSLSASLIEPFLTDYRLKNIMGLPLWDNITQAQSSDNQDESESITDDVCIATSAVNGETMIDATCKKKHSRSSKYVSDMESPISIRVLSSSSQEKSTADVSNGSSLDNQKNGKLILSKSVDRNYTQAKQSFYGKHTRKAKKHTRTKSKSKSSSKNKVKCKKSTKMKTQKIEGTTRHTCRCLYGFSSDWSSIEDGDEPVTKTEKKTTDLHITPEMLLSLQSASKRKKWISSSSWTSSEGDMI